MDVGVYDLEFKLEFKFGKNREAGRAGNAI